MRMTIVMLVMLVTACSPCGDDAVPVEVDGGTVEQIDPVAQCDELAGLACAALNGCNCWDGGGVSCADYFAARCERNLTAVPSGVMERARRTLAMYQCEPNEVCATWPDRHGEFIFDAMQSWPAPAAVVLD